MSHKLPAAVATVNELLNRITSVFNPGVKVTLMVRRPSKPDQDFMLTDDDPREVIAMIERRMAADQ